MQNTPTHGINTGRRQLQIIGIVLGIIGLLAYAISKFSSGRAVVIITAVCLLGFLISIVLLAVRTRGFWRIVKTLAVTLLAVVAGAYLILFVLVFFFQDTIANRANAFFQPRPITLEQSEAVVAADVEAIELATPDGAMLRGWLVKNSQAARAPLVIFFNGSGSESSEMIPYVRELSGWTVALINYRGFGTSTGTPSQAHAFADATLIYDALSQRPDVDSDRIVAMGYSLGTGVAVYLSAQRPTAATVLAAPYDRMTLIGLKDSPLFAPLSGIMKPYFDSLSRVPTIRSPLLVLIGADDTAVPPALSQRLASNWGGQTTVKIYEGENHGLLLHENSSWSDIAKFLQGGGQP